jgi:hypothetical protein
VVDEFKRTSRDLEKTFKEVDPTPDLKKAQKDVEDAMRSTAEAARDTLDLNK